MSEPAYATPLVLKKLRMPLFLLVCLLFAASVQAENDTALDGLNERAIGLYNTGDYVAAEALFRRYVDGTKARFGENHPQHATALNNLGELLRETNRLTEAEHLIRRALTIDEANYGKQHPNVAIRLNNLALLLQATNRLDEAEAIYRRALAIDEKSYGPDHYDVAIDLNNLAELLRTTNRLVEAELLYRRALDIAEKSPNSGDTKLGLHLNNLALVLEARDRLDEAESLYRRALFIDEASLGGAHPDVARDLNNLAELLRATNRPDEAEPLYRRALAVTERSFGPDHPHVAIRLNNLALSLQAVNRLAEAEPLYRHALAINEKSLGPNHPNTAINLANLGLLKGNQRDWHEAIVFYRQAKPAMTETGQGRFTLAQNSLDMRAYARALFRAGADDEVRRVEAFEMAQWAQQSAAADALSALSLRFAKGGGALGAVVRDEQDLRAWRADALRKLDKATGQADSTAAEGARLEIAGYDNRLATLSERLRLEFPNYAVLSQPKPVSLAEAQSLLQPGQALILFLDMPQFGKLPEETIVFAITETNIHWDLLPLGAQALQDRVAALRCGLDAEAWKGIKSSARCAKLLNLNSIPSDEELPFHLGIAHGLYKELFGKIEDLIKDKSLLVVPSGPLTSLPLQVLVTEKPIVDLPTTYDGYKNVSWLGTSRPITILPSASSLKVYKTAGASTAKGPFLGFGNPLLTGQEGADKRAWDNQSCGDLKGDTRNYIAPRVDRLASLFRKGQVDVEKLRRQAPLAESADELCRVATDLGVPPSRLDQAVQLGERATERQVKALSASGALSQVRVVHFATHGLLATEAGPVAKLRPEPALLLTPPAPDKVSEEDDGLLTASEIAQLRLDADWVVLSACNTAAGGGENAEALSGLARAFIYAGARSLLVSHWYIDSNAAVAITTRAFSAMKANDQIGPAEALRRALVSVSAQNGNNAHPSVWAPFVLVGVNAR